MLLLDNRIILFSLMFKIKPASSNFNNGKLAVCCCITHYKMTNIPYLHLKVLCIRYTHDA